MKAVKLTPSHRIYGLGAILLVSLLICSRNFTRAYLLAISEFFSTPRFPRRVIVPGLVLAALWHLQFLGVPPGPDDDIHRYLWDGRVQRVGFDPYLVSLAILCSAGCTPQRAARSTTRTYRVRIPRELSFSSARQPRFMSPLLY
jgi:hypothetical protein